MITQRNRRYKSLFEQDIKKGIKRKYSSSSEAELDWDRSNITPGTVFMSKLDKALHGALKGGKLGTGIQVILNDSSVPSEGEHKITRHIMQLQHGSDDVIAVFSNDGDMSILGLQFPTKRLITMVDTSFLPGKTDETYEYVYFDNGIFQDALIEEIFYERQKRNTSSSSTNTSSSSSLKTSTTSEETNVELETSDEAEEDVSLPEPVLRAGFEFFDNHEFSKRVYIDYMFLTFFGGNDFVKPFPFTKMRTHGTYSMLMAIYRNVKQRYPFNYLITEDRRINKAFFEELILEFSKQENKRMKQIQERTIKSCKETDAEWGPFVDWKDEWGAYQHTTYVNAGHPEHEEVKKTLLSFDYLQTDKKNHWKGQYYQYHFGLDPRNRGEYNKARGSICRDYIKCLAFTLNYYLTGIPPSWDWVYPHHAAPWPSDILVTLRHMDNIDGLERFIKGGPVKPMEQLLLTIPPQSKTFPKEFNPLKSLLPKVDHINLDKINGEKYIYAEPMLPAYNDELLVQSAKKIKLSAAAEKRNKSENIWV
jgi:5'-3' exonuclease